MTRRLSYELTQGGRPIGTLLVGGHVPPATRARLDDRVVPALEALLGAALERDRLQSEVVETRALRRSDELKTALLQTISHDLRTPLTAIMTAGAALAEGEVSRADREDLGRAILEESERLTALVEKVLDLSRLQAGVAEPRREWLSVEEILRETAAQLDSTGTRFSFSVRRRPPADPGRRRTARAGVREPARERRRGTRAPSGYRSARASWPESSKIRIVDRGPGIPHDDLARIFEAFYRGASGRDGHKGSGLGLTIVKGFIEANGGRVWAESLPGQGTSFVVAFPVEPRSRAGAAAGEARTP